MTGYDIPLKLFARYFKIIKPVYLTLPSANHNFARAQLFPYKG